MNWLQLLEFAAKAYIWVFSFLFILNLLLLILSEKRERKQYPSIFAIINWVLFFVAIKIVTMI